MKNKSDKDLWTEMELDDLCMDGKIHQVWQYLYQNRHLHVPDSWLEAISSFNDELCRKESRWNI